MPKILIVDDEEDIRELIAINLMREGYQTVHAADGLTAIKLAKSEAPDLIVLDLMLPEKDGISVHRDLREDSRTESIPVLMLTARGKLEEKITGLELGADDYMTKPFSVRELGSRIRAVLRRLNQKNTLGSIIKAGKITIDTEQYRVKIDELNVDFSPTEFRLLYFLASHPDRVYARDQLLDNVWGEQVYVDDRTVDVHIRRVRKVLEPYGCDNYISTVRGVGYRFSSSEEK